jgi:hypothetical protein
VKYSSRGLGGTRFSVNIRVCCSDSAELRDLLLISEVQKFNALFAKNGSIYYVNYLPPETSVNLRV